MHLINFAAKLCILACMGIFLVACQTLPEQQTTTTSSGGNPKAQIPAEIRAEYDKALRAAKAGRSKHAIKLFSRMANKHPEIAVIHTSLGLLYLKSARLKQAEASLKQATKLNTADAIAYNHLGVTLRGMGRFEEAKHAYQKALSINDKYANAYLNLGILYDLYIQDLSLALQQYQQYQSLTGAKNKQVGKWIIDIERRVTRQSAQGGQ